MFQIPRLRLRLEEFNVVLYKEDSFEKIFIVWNSNENYTTIHLRQNNQYIQGSNFNYSYKTDDYYLNDYKNKSSYYHGVLVRNQYN